MTLQLFKLAFQLLAASSPNLESCADSLIKGTFQKVVQADDFFISTLLISHQLNPTATSLISLV